MITLHDYTCATCGVFFRSSYRNRKYCTRKCQPRSGNYGYTRPGREATETPTVANIVWAAGIYEGEGTAGTTNTGSGCNVSVVQKDRWLIDRLRALFGGYINMASPTPTSGTRCYRWNVSGTRARGFLLTIYQFLSPRRKVQALKAMGLPVPESLSL